MSTRVDLTLSERRLSVHVTAQGTKRALVPDQSVSPEREWRQVDTLPHVLADAFKDAALHLNMRLAGDDRKADVPAFVQAVHGGEVTVYLSGPPRELSVCELYLAVEYGLDCGKRRGCVRLQPDSDGGPSIYDTMGVDISLRPIERMADDEARYLDLMEQTGGEAERRSGADGGNLAWQSLIENRRIRMGVLGDTGMGKSTFINGILRRPGLLPEDVDVCTGVIVEICHVPSVEEERFEVHLLSDSERQDICRKGRERAQFLLSGGGERGELDRLLARPFWKQFGGSKSIAQEFVGRARKHTQLGEDYYDATDSQIECAEELDALQSACEAAAKMPSRSGRTVIKDLSRIAEFVRAKVRKDDLSPARPNGWPFVTSSLTVYVNVSLLEHVTIVDTPGLRDVDDRRAERTRNELTNLNCWIYLVDSEPKGGTPRLDGIREMKSRVHVPHGIIAANKIDILVSQVKGRPIKTLFQERRRLLEREGCPVVTCSAKAASFLPARRPAEDDAQQLADDIWVEKGWGWPLVRGRVPIPPVEKKQKVIRRRAEDLVSDRIVVDDGGWQSLVDFQLDISELVNVVGTTCRVLEERVIESLVSQHKRDLAGSVESHRTTIVSEIENAQRQLDADDLHKELTDLFSERDSERDGLQQKKRMQEEEVKAARKVVASARKDCLDSADREAKLLLQKLPGKVKEAMAEIADWQMRGDVDFSIHSIFTTPLATAAGEQVAVYGEKVVEAWNDVSFLTRQDIETVVQARTENFNLEQAFSSVKVFEAFWEWFTTTQERGVDRAKKTAKAIQTLILGDEHKLRRLGTSSIHSNDRDMVPGMEKALAAARNTKEGRLPARMSHIEDGLEKLVKKEAARLDKQIAAKTKEIKKLKGRIADAKKQIHKSRTALEKELRDRQQRLSRLDRFLETIEHPHQ